MKKHVCKVCGGIMGEPKLYPYYEKVLGKRMNIGKVGGRECLDCGDIEYDDDIATKSYINQQITKKAAQITQDKDAVPILVSYIRKYRLESKVSQKLIAQALGVSEQRIGAIERNLNTPTVVTFYQIAQILGRSPESLYELVYIDKEIYDKIKNMELFYANNKPQFQIVDEVQEYRKELSDLRDGIKELNSEKRKYRTKHKKGEISLEEFNTLSGKIDQEKNYLNEIKNGVKGKIGLEEKLKKIESEYNLILKQENVIESEHWEALKNEFPNELN